MKEPSLRLGRYNNYLRIMQGNRTVAVISDQNIDLNEGYSIEKGVDCEPIMIDLLKGDKTACVPLSKVPTMTLLDELMSRDGVFSEEVGPYETKSTYVNGPAMLLITMI